MRYWSRFSLILLLVSLTGCANFAAVKGFSEETGKLTSATADEFRFVSTHCLEVAKVRWIVEGVDSKGGNCEKLAGAVGELTSNTNEVLVIYGQRLGALADAKQFDFGENLQKTKASFIGLKDREGKPKVDTAVVNAGIAITDLLLKLATETQRREAVGQLLAEKESIRVLAGFMKVFFVGDSSGTQPLYQLQLKEDDGSLKDVIDSLGALSSREPIRAREWTDDVKARRQLLKKRVDGSVGRHLGDAIDAWMASLDKLSSKAFEPDWKEWKEQYEALKSRVNEVKKAIDSARK